jgi:DNA sulfur modification protein DndD
MIIKKLTLTDFQVFQGRHELDLETRTKYNRKRPIVLFGGLNGAGKTTMLTAVRLALYGKQILGIGASNKAYESYLEGCIHNARDSIVQANSAGVELDFTYAKLGELKNYRVTRQWMITGKKLTETLHITENDSRLSELSKDQCQGFLNELVPVGVSELFFFDGEKIKELAEDGSGLALGDAIKKLLGLDVLDTLRADLGIYLRNAAKANADKAIRVQMSALESELEKIEKMIVQELDDIDQVKPKICELNQKISHSENQLSEQGGAWANSREREIEKQASFSAQREAIKRQLQEVISGNYPIPIANSYTKSALRQLNKESSYQKSLHTAELVEGRLSALDNKLQKQFPKIEYEKINKEIRSTFSILTETQSQTQIIHDKSDGTLSRIESTINDAINNQQPLAKELSQRLTEIENELDKAGQNIARAPIEEKIKPLMSELLRLQSEHSKAIVVHNGHIESYKKLIRESMDIVRKLDVLAQSSIEASGNDRATEYARQSRVMLKSFSSEMAKRKTADLESEFVRSFHQLARKEDIKISAKIDPSDFSVMLFSETGQAIDKNRLSAGEKQIYAISILEALARTSGRKLPIIIDTPLGRLDSNHRANLVNNYFPHASHQVIILSTDTEVDEEFYRELSPHISHAYKLNYDSKTGSTTPIEEYFWKPLLKESA